MKTRQKTRILVVEDDIIVARDIEESLKELGYTVTCIVSSGEQAVKKAASKKPDLALMDIHLKGEMDGIEAADHIREMDIPVVYLTAYSDEKTLERAGATGPFGYIVKPFEERNLHTVIEMAIYKHAMDSRLRALKEYSENVVESMPVGVAVTDEEGMLLTINRLQEDIYGKDRESVKGKRVFRDYLPELGEIMEPLLKKTIGKGETVQVKGVDYRNGTGREHVLDINMAPLMEKDRVTGAVIASSDVSEKKGLENKVRALEKKDVSGLTRNDKKVLRAIVENPDATALKLAKTLDMKRTTVIGIRKKLKNGGYYKTLRIPALPALGMNHLRIEFGRFSAGLTDIQKEEITRFSASPRRIYVILTDGKFMHITAARDAAEYSERPELFDCNLDKSDLSEDYVEMEFSLPASRVVRFFEYSGVCDSRPAKGLKEGVDEFWKTGKKRLGKNESLLLSAMLRHPGLSNTGLSEKTDLSKVSVSNIRKRLTEKGLVRTCRAPDLKKLGWGFLLALSLPMRPAHGGKSADLLKHMPAPLIHLEDMRQAFALIPFRNYDEYRQSYEHLCSDPLTGRYLRSGPRTLLLPLKNLREHRTDYTGIL